MYPLQVIAQWLALTYNVSRNNYCLFVQWCCSQIYNYAWITQWVTIDIPLFGFVICFPNISVYSLLLEGASGKSFPSYYMLQLKPIWFADCVTWYLLWLWWHLCLNSYLLFLCSLLLLMVLLLYTISYVHVRPWFVYCMYLVVTYS